MFTQGNKRLLPLQFTVHRRGNDDASNKIYVEFNSAAVSQISTYQYGGLLPDWPIAATDVCVYCSCHVVIRTGLRVATSQSHCTTHLDCALC